MSFNEVQNADASTSYTSALSGKTALKLKPYHGPDLGHADFVVLFDDFLGDVIADQWSAADGSDDLAVAVAVVTAGNNGLLRLTTGDAGSGIAADGSSLTHMLNWLPSNGGLRMETRLKINTAVTNIALNVGFTDTLATTTLEMPITISGTTITTDATDAAVFVFDTAQTNDFFHLQGVKNNTDTALLNSAVAPVADTFIHLAVEIDASGNATYYIDGVLKGSVANAVTPSVALTPIIVANARTTTSKVVDIDYIRVSQLRA